MYCQSYEVPAGSSVASRVWEKGGGEGVEPIARWVNFGARWGHRREFGLGVEAVRD